MMSSKITNDYMDAINKCNMDLSHYAAQLYECSIMQKHVIALMEMEVARADTISFDSLHDIFKSITDVTLRYSELIDQTRSLLDQTIDEFNEIIEQEDCITCVEI